MAGGTGENAGGVSMLTCFWVLGIFLGGAGIGSAAFGVTVVPPQEPSAQLEHVEQPPSQHVAFS
jgi:hypothetical protein